MSGRALETGKLPPDLLRELLEAGPSLPPEVLLGPGVGEDACAISLPPGALIAATDPITLTGSDVGAHAVVINANDVAVMGVRPRWFLAAVMLPVGTTADDVRSLFAGMRRGLASIDVALVGGHTEITASVVQPVVVGQMLGHAENGRFVRTGGLEPGDVVAQVGAAPVEGAAVLAAECAELLDGLDKATLAAARGALERPGISVVDAALRAAACGAVALHDPTESGLSAGLHELAEASRVGLELDADSILWFGPGVAVCRALGADPWGVLASGRVLAGFRRDAAEAALARLSAAGHLVSAVGVAVDGSAVRLGSEGPLPRFDRDEVARVLSQRGGD